MHTSLSQDGFYHRGIWVEHPMTSLPFDLPGAFLSVCGQGGLLTSGVRDLWPGQGPASSFNCPAILILEFRFTGNESLIALPSRVGIYLLLQYKVCFGKFILCERAKSRVKRDYHPHLLLHSAFLSTLQSHNLPRR